MIPVRRETTLLVLLSVFATAPVSTDAWVSIAPSALSNHRQSHASISTRSPLPTTTTTTTTLFADNSNNNNPFAFLFNPYESKIPDTLKDEIYAAEARTPAAQSRSARVATYATFAFIGIVLAFFSAFITELRNTPLPEGETGDPLAVAGFTWVYSNFLFQFLFTNKLGGGLCLLLGAGSGLMAEAELDTKRINAEKIFEELDRRRQEKGKGGSSSKGDSKQARKGKKRRPGKEKKRLQALSELVVEEPVAVEGEKVVPNETEETTNTVTAGANDEDKASKNDGDDGILGKIKGFYNQADSMAASQALLLNKKLEEEGLVEKITDESGLKVVGREEAAKLQGKNSDKDKERK